MAWELLRYEKGDGIATITFNRPEVLNAMNPALQVETALAVAEVERDDEVKVGVLTGTGRGFCAGADVASLGQASDPGRVALMEHDRALREEPLAGWGKLMKNMRACRKPLLAAVNGVAAGAGLSVALGCDLRFASDQSRFAAIFVRRALCPDAGACYTLPRTVGLAKALELMWTGDIIDAQEALRLGLVTRVVPHDQLMATTREFALRLVRGPSLSIELTKRLVYQGLEANNFVADLAAEAWAQGICSASEDSKEGVRAFLEKREPVFKGR